MDITEQFEVAKPVETVWTLFQDVPELARCLPGAELTSDNGDGTYDGKVSVKLGPISASFEGKATVGFDHDEYSMALQGKGVDRSGGSQGRVNVDVHLFGTDERSTAVTIDAKVMLAGPIAQFGRTGLVNEVSRRLIDEFSDCVQAKLDAASPEESSTIIARDIKGLTLFLTSTWSTVTNWVKDLIAKR